MALSLTKKGLGGGSRKLALAVGPRQGSQTRRGPLSSQTGPGSPALPPYPTPGRLCFKQALGLLLHGNRRLLFQSDVAALQHCLFQPKVLSPA